jgi:Cytochrome c bacterial
VVKKGDRLEIAPAAGVDVLAAARAVGRPTSETCLRCHLGPGGGPNHKHGVAPTSAEVDVHVAKGLSCIDCHHTRNHRIAGGADIKAHEAPEVKVTCAGCHEGKAHRGARAAVLEAHTARLACQTCHVPAIARDPSFPTVVRRDWTKPVLNEKTGLYGPTNQMAGGVKPEYRWWNRKMRVPPEPEGGIGDPESKIFPWKRTSYTVIADAKSGKPVFIKAGLYAVKGDPLAAAKKGAEDAKQEFSGAIRGVDEGMVFSLNHQVAPKGQALACDACHRPGGVMDFRALGYPEDRAKALAAPR